MLVEKPLGTTVESCRELRDRAADGRLVVQVGNNRRFDPGIAFARRFIREEMGQRIALKAWYYDSVYRYTMTDNLQPIPLTSRRALRPGGDPKADRRRYYILTHSSHLVDTARLLGGPIAGVRARLLERFGAYCWFIAVDFEDGSLGHLDLQIPVRGDFQEGFQVFGEHGSVSGRVYLPWFHKSSDVECFSTRGPAIPPRPRRGRAHVQAADRGVRGDDPGRCAADRRRTSTTDWPPCRRWSRSRARWRRGELVRLADVSGGV